MTPHLSASENGFTCAPDERMRGDMTPQFWLWLDAILMAGGGALLLAIGKRRTPHEEAHTALHGVVPFIAACAYFAMAVGQGQFSLPIAGAGGVARDFYYARYIDWLFTTPLLLVALSMTAVHAMPRRHGTVAAMLVADVMMIVTAFLFGVSVSPELKWTWFIISCAAFLPVYWVIWRPLDEEARIERDDVRKAWRTEATMLSVLWFTYPVILLISTDGLGLVGSTASVALIAIVDLLTKPVFGFVAIRNQSRIVERDLAEGGGTKATLRRAA